jgi:hypothetical protein
MKMSQVSLNGNVLKKIANASHTAEVVMLDMGLRERVRPFSDIHRTRNRLIREGNRIIEDDYKAFWKSLQDAGAGVIVYGRKGQPDRFQWHYSMKKVAEAALEGKDITAEKLPVGKQLKIEKPVTTKSEQRTKPAPKRAETKEVFIPLRADFCLGFSVPADLSKNEAEMIATALRRLAA